MGFFKKLFSSKKNNNKSLPEALIDDTTIGVMGIMFACYLRWVENTTKKSIAGKELKRRIGMFLVVLKKDGKINDFNSTDIFLINIGALAPSMDVVDTLNEESTDLEFHLLEELMGLKKK